MDPEEQSEFTGEHREVYEIRLSLSVRREVKHKTEGWMKMPGSDSVEQMTVAQLHIDSGVAQREYDKLKAELLA